MVITIVGNGNGGSTTAEVFCPWPVVIPMMDLFWPVCHLGRESMLLIPNFEFNNFVHHKCNQNSNLCYRYKWHDGGYYEASY